MKTFYVTFGIQYADEPHPLWPKAHPDGYLTIIAKDEEMARRLTAALLATRWAFMYSHEEFDRTKFSRGELGCIAFMETP
jgi:hypothetical protein